MSTYFLISQLTVLCTAMGFGYIMDKIMVWKMVLLFHTLMIVAIVVFVSYTPTQDGIYNATEH